MVGQTTQNQKHKLANLPNAISVYPFPIHNFKSRYAYSLDKDKEC